MNRKRLTLDNPAFADRLRQVRRSPSYERRPTPSPTRTIQDFGLIRSSLSPQSKVARTGSQVVAKSAAVIATTPGVKPASGPLRRPQTHVTAHVPQKSVVLHRKAVRRPTPSGEGPQESVDTVTVKHRRPVALYAMAGAVFVVGLVISLNGLRANRQVAAQVKHLSSNSQAADGASASAPSTTKPTPSDISGYVVAPNLPRYIDIPKLTVHARIKSMGVSTKNQLQAPGNVYDAGWYNASAQPGQPGAMLIDGHISSWTTQGVFYGLNKLKAGDAITITRGDGQKFTYGVVKVATVDAKSVDMSSLLVSADTAKPGLNLISCSGDVIPGSNEFDKRITVYATLQ